MTDQNILNDRLLREGAAAARFLETPNADSFADLFKIFTPQLTSFFRARDYPGGSARTGWKRGTR
jgi:hypothetical protein